MNTTPSTPVFPQRTSGATQNPGAINGKLNYLVPASETPIHYTYTPPEGTPWENVEYEAREVEIRDARLSSTRLDVQGFELWEAPSEVSDFDNLAEVRSVYYPEIERLVKLATGANRVIVFDHLVRQCRTENNQALRIQMQQAQEKGIFGAPMFVVHRELFWGNDRLEDAINYCAEVNSQ